MRVLLVQHGKSKSKEEDPERSLTDAGVRETKKMAAWLSHQPVDIVEVRHSGKLRAKQTAEIFANRLAPSGGVNSVSGLNPNDDVTAYARLLEDMDGVVMIVGHLPFLGRLAGFMVTGNSDSGVVSFVNSGVVCLEREEKNWSVAWAIVPDLLNNRENW